MDIYQWVFIYILQNYGFKFPLFLHKRHPILIDIVNMMMVFMEHIVMVRLYKPRQAPVFKLGTLPVTKLKYASSSPRPSPPPPPPPPACRCTNQAC